ncbi:hypothetical protein AArc1_2690 [Natrarchaeobaculum sulfurireducens]|uniref:Uncharacterized protein n=1 Tax=Natrarchaeobaculum sulfurireducens TaxID=2044521 RepID=A0A346PHK8_9EURY|nr:hypothetical protein AArc1_2690 [Natrarchaeobaculum sulfurireducens]
MSSMDIGIKNVSMEAGWMESVASRPWVDVEISRFPSSPIVEPSRSRVVPGARVGKPLTAHSLDPGACVLTERRSKVEVESCQPQVRHRR